MAPVPPVDQLIQLVANTTDAFTTALFFHHPSDGRYHLTSHCSLSKNVDPQFTFSEGEGYWGWVARHGRPLNISPFSHVYGPLGIYRRKEDVKSFLAVPLEGKRGVLSVDSKATYVFTDRIAKLLLDFGRMAVTLRLLEERFQQAQEAERFLLFLISLEEATGEGGREPELDGILERCRRFFGADLTFWAESVLHSDEYYIRGVEGALKGHPFLNRRLNVQDGLVGLTFRKGQAFFLETLSSDSRKSFIFHPHEPLIHEGAFACLPVRKGQRVSAVWGMAFLEPKTWSRYEMRALGILSGLLAHRL
jgi:signal transduction protein with GAF and PtsI domain